MSNHPYVGFTGTRSVNEDVLYWMFDRNSLTEWCGDHDGFVTGACVGFDTFVGSYLFTQFPDRHHIVFVPANRSQVCEWWKWPKIQDIAAVYGGPQIIEMLPGTTYKDRNQAIVDHSDVMIALAEYPEEHPKSRRSGTWQTVRLAKADKLPVNIYTASDKSFRHVANTSPAKPRLRVFIGS